MGLKISENCFIGENYPTFLIAEIGQNHQGQISVAKKLIKEAKRAGADCVKFQKSCLPEKFTASALNREYKTENSWGATYGDHKKYLEFTEDQFVELQSFAKEENIFFSASAMDLTSLEFLHKIQVPFIKIGSGDANNFPLIEKAAALFKPLIISTGMQTFSTVKQIYKTVAKYHNQFALLHCVSSYPCSEENINLNIIKEFRKNFNVQIGYSGHEIGCEISALAVIAGATIIERHFTLDKNQKGSDHKCSLVPEEFAHLVKEIRRMETLLGNREKKILQCEMPCRLKLGKSLVSARKIEKDTVLQMDDLTVKVSEPQGIYAENIFKVIGCKSKKFLEVDQPIQFDDIIFLN